MKYKAHRLNLNVPACLRQSSLTKSCSFKSSIPSHVDKASGFPKTFKHTLKKHNINIQKTKGMGC